MIRKLTIVLLLLFLFVGTASAVTWTNAGGYWTAPDGPYTVVKVNATGPFSVPLPAGVTSIYEYLVIAAGGNGGAATDGTPGGGGGAGGLRNGTSLVASGSISGTVGAASISAPRGGNSSLGNIEATGGGSGQYYNGNNANAQQPGGSGGGANYGGAGANGNFGGYTPAEGYKGGITGNATGLASTGGGGFGGVGGNASPGVGGNGGPGVTISITGDPVCYGGGGGGSIFGAGYTLGTGTCGGADGRKTVGSNNGEDEKGGGGGAGGTVSGSYGRGGNGSVIFKYLTPSTAPPASITNLANNTATCQNITWSWTNPSDADYAYLYTLKNNVWTGNYSNSTSAATWTGLSAATPYTFSSKTVNLNMTANASWVNMTATTIASLCPQPQVVANFTANTTTQVIPPGAIQFNDTSSLYGGIPDVWLWNFGDGTTSTERNNTHVYSTSGLKTVSLTVSRSEDPSNTDTETKTNYINVTYFPFYVHADFSGNPTSGSPGLLVSFADLTTVGNTTAGRTCNWSFGDSLSITPFSSSCGNVQHVYTYAGVYDVNLSVTMIGNTSYENKLMYITVSTVQNAQNTNVVWNARDVAIQVLDANNNPIKGTPVSLSAYSSSLPGGLSGAIEYFRNTYGVPESVAISMLAANTTYASTTDDYGFVAAQVVGVIQYQITTQDINGINETRLFWPSGPYYQITTANATVAGVAAQGRAQNSIYQNSTFNTTFWEPNTTHSCMGINVYDSTGKTSYVYAWWKLMDNGTIWSENSTSVGGYGPVNSTRCVLHVPYQSWKWGGITG